jgi:hypothetical protein
MVLPRQVLRLATIWAVVEVGRVRVLWLIDISIRDWSDPDIGKVQRGRIS